MWTAIEQGEPESAHPLPDYRLLNLRYGVRFEAQDMDKVQPIALGIIGNITRKAMMESLQIETVPTVIIQKREIELSSSGDVC